MSEQAYTAEYDGHLGLYRWQIRPGAHLLDAPPAPRQRLVRVVALGGGSGLPSVLRGLKAVLFPRHAPWVPARDPERLTAIVTVADDGGSSGRLRQAYRVLPPGDIRSCLLALSDGDPALAEMFDFRFAGGDGLGGHSLGNLILTALSQLQGDFLEAVERGGRILSIRGQILPATLDDVTLRAEFEDGSAVDGESRITAARRPIRRVALEPAGARALPRACAALRAADLVVIGPGSLYTSLIPVLLVRELAKAIAASHARVVLVMNLMTEPGETDAYSAADHVLAIRRHVPEVPIHDVLLNTAPVPADLVARYAAEGAVPVPPDAEAVGALGARAVTAEVLDGGPQARHDSARLARALLALATEALA